MPPIRAEEHGVERFAPGRGRRTCHRVDEWRAPAFEPPYWMFGDYQLDVDFEKTSTWYDSDGDVHDTVVSNPTPIAPSTKKLATDRYLQITIAGKTHGVHEVVAYFHANPKRLSWTALKDSESSITRKDGVRVRVKRYHVHHAGKRDGKPDLTNNLRASLEILPCREHERRTRRERKTKTPQ